MCSAGPISLPCAATPATGRERNLPTNLAEGEWSCFTTIEVAPWQDRVGLNCTALLRYF